MHRYCISSDIRENITKYIVKLILLINIIIVILYLNLNNFEFKLNIISYILNISMFLFWIINYLFDKYIWKFKYVQKIHKIPDLNGIWNGNFISCKVDEFGNNYTGECEMKITQTWNKIHIKSSFNESTSYSRTATIKVNDTTGIELEFSYENKADKTVNENLKAHNGTNILIYDETNNKLNGNYYTDRNRKTDGILEVSR